jgi:hypothetical protein
VVQLSANFKTFCAAQISPGPVASRESVPLKTKRSNKVQPSQSTEVQILASSRPRDLNWD